MLTKMNIYIMLTKMNIYIYTCSSDATLTRWRHHMNTSLHNPICCKKVVVSPPKKPSLRPKLLQRGRRPLLAVVDQLVTN